MPGLHLDPVVVLDFGLLDVLGEFFALKQVLLEVIGIWNLVFTEQAGECANGNAVDARVPILVDHEIVQIFVRR